MQSYFPCEDGLVKSSIAQKDLHMVQKIDKNLPIVDTRAIFTDYLVNLDLINCPILKC
jgi:hypothetical protein